MREYNNFVFFCFSNFQAEKAGAAEGGNCGLYKGSPVHHRLRQENLLTPHPGPFEVSASFPYKDRLKRLKFSNYLFFNLIADTR
jgi:hypothetical protein